VPTFQIRIVNSDFNDCSEADASDANEAKSIGLKGALQIGTDEIRRGAGFFGAEVSAMLDGETLSRTVVALGASSLQ
jgi:hypothetical protein